MARPPQNTINGTWSLTQISKAAGITMRTARTLTNNQWLPAHDLTVNHVVVARVAAALLDAPSLDGRGKMSSLVVDRNKQIVDRVHRLLQDRHTSAWVLVSAEEWHIASSMSRMMAFVEDQQTPTPVLMIPVGAWVQEVRDARRR